MFEILNLKTKQKILIKFSNDLDKEAFMFAKHLSEDNKNKAIGIKKYFGKVYIATNCIKNNCYHKKNYKKYYGLHLIYYFLEKKIPIIENVFDIINIKNDNRIYRTTVKSKIFVIYKV